MINVLFFARIRDQVGMADVQMTLPEHVNNVQAFTGHLIEAHPACAGIIDHSSVLVAVNQEFAHAETTVQDGDEIAYFPPVTGG